MKQCFIEKSFRKISLGLFMQRQQQEMEEQGLLSQVAANWNEVANLFS